MVGDSIPLAVGPSRSATGAFSEGLGGDSRYDEGSLAMPQIDPKSKLGLFISHVVPGVARPMRVLWNEIIGFLFVVIAVPMVFSAFRSYHAGDSQRMLIAGGFALMLLYFGVTSFVRARKISRS